MKALKEAAYRANMDLQASGCVLYTFGNVSVADQKNKVMAIKPSGVPYEELTPDSMVLVSLTTGEVIESKFRPSSDTPTHLEIYRAFPCEGVVHSHSRYATTLAQCCLPVRCMGTTHADYFRGDIPVTRQLTEEEITKDYEKNTGIVIAQTFENKNPMEIPAVLVANHGPFTWGKDGQDAVHNAVILEYVAQMEISARMIRPDAPIPANYLVEKHYTRKHGAKAYYGQKI